MNMQPYLAATASAAAPIIPMTPEVRAAWDSIDAIDLANVKRKLMLPLPEGNAWAEETADLAIDWYRRFLKLNAKYPVSRLVPSRFIDEAWHLHILDTRAYEADCKRVFGGMLHHYPYYGMNGDAAQRDDSFDQTDLLYIAEFGVSCKEAHGPVRASMCDGDGGGCDNNVGRASMCDGGVGDVKQASMCDGGVGDVHPSMCDGGVGDIREV